jgi:F0F1-type ATP synthase epsilon subunit
MADHEKFPVEVLTPDGEVFAEDVQMISTRTTIGSIGILAHHMPLLAMLDPTELRLYRSDSDVVSFAQSEGYLQVADNRALLLVEEASCAIASSRPSASSTSPARTPSAGGWPSATSAAWRRSSGSPRAAPDRVPLAGRHLDRLPSDVHG